MYMLSICKLHISLVNRQIFTQRFPSLTVKSIERYHAFAENWLWVRLFGDVAAWAVHAAVFCGDGRFSKRGKTAAWKGRYDGTAFNVRARPHTQRVVSAIRYIYKSKITILPPLPPPSSLLPSANGTIAIVGIVAIAVATVPTSC